MLFNRFIKICKKYKFTFGLSTYGGLSLILFPIDTYESIKIKDGYFDFNRVFKKAIKEIKKYRNERGY